MPLVATIEDAEIMDEVEPEKGNWRESPNSIIPVIQERIEAKDCGSMVDKSILDGPPRRGGGEAGAYPITTAKPISFTFGRIPLICSTRNPPSTAQSTTPVGRSAHAMAARLKLRAYPRTPPAPTMSSHGHKLKANAVTTVSKEFANVLVAQNQFHALPMLRASAVQPAPGP